MKSYLFRLHRGADLCDSIKSFAKENHIKAGYVACCVGCVSRARVRDASGVNIRELNEEFEIVSVTGTVSEKRCHMHIALSREDLSTVGGHMVSGCIVNTTAEVVINEIDGVEIGVEEDKETGYDELVVLTV